MKHRTLFIVGAIVLLVYGLLWLLFPVFGLSIHGTENATVHHILITRYWGSAYVGLAVIMWLAQKADTDSVAVKAIMIGGLVMSVTGLAVAIMNAVAGGNPLIWLSITLYVLFSIWLGYFVFKKQS